MAAERVARADIALRTVSSTRWGEMRRYWGTLEWGEGREKLFNHCQMGLFVPLEKQNLRRAGVCFLCRKMTRGKVEMRWNFPFLSNLQITFKDWKVLRCMRTRFGWDEPGLSTSKWAQPWWGAAWLYCVKDINFLLTKWEGDKLHMPVLMWPELLYQIYIYFSNWNSGDHLLNQKWVHFSKPKASCISKLLVTFLEKKIQYRLLGYCPYRRFPKTSFLH